MKTKSENKCKCDTCNEQVVYLYTWVPCDIDKKQGAKMAVAGYTGRNVWADMLKGKIGRNKNILERKRNQAKGKR